MIWTGWWWTNHLYNSIRRADYIFYTLFYILIANLDGDWLTIHESEAPRPNDVIIERVYWEKQKLLLCQACKDHNTLDCNIRSIVQLASFRNELLKSPFGNLLFFVIYNISIHNF
jgi:hypothetical protein